MYLLAIEVSTNIFLASSTVVMSIERFGGGGRRLGSNSHLNKMVILGVICIEAFGKSIKHFATLFRFVYTSK